MCRQLTAQGPSSPFQMHLSRSKRLGSKGFSLVEVTLALGITAVALVSLMGMLPKGLQTLQQANDKAVMGRIHQQILGELQLTSWEPKETGGSPPLESFDKQVRFYDDQGIELPASEKGEFNHIYTARISLPKSGTALPESVGGGSFGGVALPGEQETSDDFLRLVLVEITSNVDESFLNSPETGFDSLNYPNAVYTYRTMVAKMGRTYDTP